MRKGFTLLEALIVIVLVSIVSIFFLSVFTSALKITTKSREDTKAAFDGQAAVEQKVVDIFNEASQYHKKLPGAKAPDRNVNLWGRKIEGYGVNVQLGKEPSDPKERGTIRGKVLTFVFAGERAPELPVLTFNLLNSPSKTVPKFIYLENYDLKSAKEYSYSISVTNPQLLQRIVERQYFSNKFKDIDGTKYILRPYTDFKEDVSSSGTIVQPPLYSAFFSNGYSVTDSKGANLFDGGKIIPKNIKNTEFQSPIKFPSAKRNNSGNAQQDLDSLKDMRRDTAFLKTLQVQTGSGYAGPEVISTESISWFIGTPVTNGLVGQWDANLYFDSNLNDNIVSFKDNTVVGSSSSTLKEWQEVRELAKNEKVSSISFKGDLTLKIRKDNDDRSYRQFSNGVSMLPNSSASNRIKIETQNGSLMDTKNPNTAMIGKMGSGNYSIIIRAKQANPSSDSALFTVNMNNVGAIDDNNSGNEASGVFLTNSGNSISYKYDAGVAQTDPSKRYINSQPIAISKSKYDSLIKTPDDDRSGYRIFELSLLNAGVEDMYNINLLVDNTKHNLTNNSPQSIDLDRFGIELGSNLEISDILVYNRTLTNDESKKMAEYLLNKYIVK